MCFLSPKKQGQSTEELQSKFSLLQTLFHKKAMLSEENRVMLFVSA